jgi:MoxR-vWA-beta-propeller ternary system domain bpX4
MSRRVRQLIEQLFVDGVVRVAGDELARDDEIEAAADGVLLAEPQMREHWPLSPPVVDRDALKWAIRQFHGAAQLAVFRQLGPEEVAKRLGDDFVVEGDAASAIYSVDLVFRFLPDLVRIVKGMNPDDPLLAQLRRWGERWPLSSVGILGLSVSGIEPILANRCLSMMYVDRIIEADAIDRLNHPQLQELIRGAIGAYPELSPKLYRFITAEHEATIEPTPHD